MAPVALSDLSLNDNDNSSYRLPLGDYVFKRIASLGINSVFGVPGDFNLQFLEHLYETPSIKWYGNCNELNAGYATDGYARTTGKMGVLVTTFGVGELSAMNAISGSFSEFVPVLHIVGTTSLSVKAQGLHTHHLVPPKSTRDLSNHYAYEGMVDKISCKVESLTSLKGAAGKIDCLIKEILRTKKPGYLYLPCDLVDQLIDASNLNEVPGHSFYLRESIISEPSKENITDLILSRIYNSSKPVVLADILTDRFNLTSQLRQFINLTNIPNSSTAMGKSILDESNESYIGDYVGDESNEEVAKYVRSSDLLIHVGDYYNEINSGHYSLYNGISEDNLILLNPEYIKIGAKVFYESFQDILPNLIHKLKVSKLPHYPSSQIKVEIKENPSSTPISQTTLLNTIQNFIRPNDVIISETCSVMFGLHEVRLPKNAKLIGQHFYLSIGMALPCSFGVSVALREMEQSDPSRKKSRVVLLEGDGSAQMTIQELANFNRHGLSPLILLLNNNGYTVERIIKGPERDYNDIMPNWKWTKIFDVFGYEGAKCVKVEQPEELEKAVKEFADGDVARLIEVVLDPLDVPARFKFMCNC